jgi:predicted HicB family RNase H-like nuclease
MSKKITLKLEKMVIDRAKDYAKKQHTSLSRLIENYLLSLTNEPENEKITPLVKSLSGILDLPNDTDDKEGYFNYLSKKHQ